ncbi:MAG: carboxylating nicotinate-nucleotide diphosphorylase [Planctomycetota bacterium]
MQRGPENFTARERAECERLIDWGLDEDLGSPMRDLTSEAVIPVDQRASALVMARQTGVIAGTEALPLLGDRLGYSVEVLRSDGPVEKGTPIARLAGTLRSVLAGERLSLNLLGRLSGVASLTARYVNAIRGTKACIVDTRKTTPGWRYLEKYAVRIGGGTNHRVGLFDGVLIKDNHLAAVSERESKPILVAVARAREQSPAGTVVEVEIDSLSQLEEAIHARPDMILLDNMIPENLGLAVEIRDRLGPGILLEASGGIHLESVVAVARSGVDRISVGALTHSAAVLDVALDYEELRV